MRKRTLFASTVVALAAVAASPGIASAAGGDPGPAAHGRLGLGSMAGPYRILTYTSCTSPAKTTTPGTYTSFDNEPLTGCQVALVNAKGGIAVLCAGRGSVPADYQSRPIVLVRKGLSVACP